MSLSLRDLMQDERYITLEIGEGTVEIHYRPSAFTPVVEDEMQRLIETNRPGNGLARMLAGIVIDWDVLDENGQPLEPTVENLRRLPVAFLTRVTNAINRDSAAEKDDLKNSGAGSRRRGR